MSNLSRSAVTTWLWPLLTSAVVGSMGDWLPKRKSRLTATPRLASRAPDLTASAHKTHQIRIDLRNNLWKKWGVRVHPVATTPSSWIPYGVCIKRNRKNHNNERIYPPRDSIFSSFWDGTISGVSCSTRLRNSLDNYASYRLHCYWRPTSGQSNMPKAASNPSGNRDSRPIQCFWGPQVSTPSRRTSIHSAAFTQQSCSLKVHSHDVA